MWSGGSRSRQRVEGGGSMRDIIAPVIGRCRACGANLSVEMRVRATEDWADRYQQDERLRRSVDRAVAQTVVLRHERQCPALRQRATRASA